ncbi:MAG TPA: metallophosphoesterase family protein [Myxococcota bacterium]|nr:metallophosphoesterase family protein [Myxococcota bacterium]
MALYGVLGDIHGNREALEAALAGLDRRGVHRLLCVGDLVGYNADPDACVTILRARGALAIAGNHDLIGTGRLGFERCSNKAMHSLKRTRGLITAQTERHLRALPSHALVEEHVLLTHGGVRDVQQYMTKPKHFLENVAYLRQDFPGRRICFFGHTHEQGVFEVHDGAVASIPPDGRVALRTGREYFINPGSVDASRKRSSKLAEFAIFDSDALAVEFHRAAYDDAATEDRAAEHGFRIERWRDRLYDVQRRLVGPRGKDA